MKEISLYACEICGTQYKSKIECTKCETGHKRPKKIMSEIYHSIKVDASGYPESINVKMDDGNIIRYKRH